MTGYERDAGVDEFERKMALRKNRRRPVEQTIAEIGEGRGKHIVRTTLLTDRLTVYRCLWRWLRGEESGEIEGEIRHRSPEDSSFAIKANM